MKIEKEIPFPGYPVVDRGYYPFNKMEAGDSVFFENESLSGKAYNASRNQQKRYGGKFAARSVEGGLRIWRIE